MSLIVMDLRDGGDSLGWFFAATAHWQSDHQDEAREWYDKAVARMDEHQPDNEQLQRFRALVKSGKQVRPNGVTILPISNARSPRRTAMESWEISTNTARPRAWPRKKATRTVAHQNITEVIITATAE